MKTTVKDTADMSIKVEVSPLDKHTKMHCVKVITCVKDLYNGKDLEPRNFRMHLSPQEMKSLAKALATE